MDSDERNLFVFPGGHLFITKGLLTDLSSAYELYYLLGFEACLVHDKFLFNRLLLEYNTSTLAALADGQTSSEASLSEVAYQLRQLSFESEIIQQVDELTANLICTSSIMDRTGIVPMLENSTSRSNQWLSYRTNYDRRMDFILNDIEAGSKCGSFKTNGSYQLHVLDKL